MFWPYAYGLFFFIIVTFYGHFGCNIGASGLVGLYVECFDTCPEGSQSEEGLPLIVIDGSWGRFCGSFSEKCPVLRGITFKGHYTGN